MTFYLNPPRGEIPLNRLLALAQTRWSFLIQLMGLRGNCTNEEELNKFLSSRSTIEDSECLIEGSVKDRISHFILRLSCASKDDMKDLFVAAETTLFALRIKSMASSDLLQLCQDLHRQTAKSKKLTLLSNGLPRQMALLELVDVLHNVSRQLRSQLTRSSRETESSHCDVIKVPFQFILPLVASRSVTLVGGIGLVPFGDIHILLEILFLQHLTLALDELKQTVDSFGELFEIDSRIGDVHREMKGIFLASKKQQTPASHNCTRRLLHSEIDEESKFFPPCMRFLHERLRRNHRLKHLSRIQYSLFLKEVGLPIEEALEFWQHEYNQPPKTVDQEHGQHSSGCNHNWQLHKKRYHYNIRHLYGLEGSRRTYITHCCQQTHNRVLGPLEEAGCPFKHFDQHNLHDYLGNAGVTDSDKRTILFLANDDSSPSLACKHYMEGLVASTTSGLSSDSSQSLSGSNSKLLGGPNVCHTSQLPLQDGPPSEVSMDNGDVVPSENKKVNWQWRQTIGLSFSRPSEFYFILRRAIDEATVEQ